MNWNTIYSTVWRGQAQVMVNSLTQGTLAWRVTSMHAVFRALLFQSLCTADQQMIIPSWNLMWRCGDQGQNCWYWWFSNALCQDRRPGLATHGRVPIFHKMLQSGLLITPEGYTLHRTLSYGITHHFNLLHHTTAALFKLAVSRVLYRT